MHTEGSVLQDELVPDLQIFTGADEIRNTSGTATLTLNASGNLSLNIAASQACVFVCSELESYRTGVYATTQLTQEQFGTAAAQPGPSTVANTSGPLSLAQAKPPVTAAQMATLGNILRGPMPKGFMITSIDVIYNVGVVPLTTAQVGITKTAFVNNVAPAVTNILAKAANGLPTAVQANPYVTNVPIASPVLITSTDTELIIEVDLTTAATGTCNFYGFVLHVSYNLN